MSNIRKEYKLRKERRQRTIESLVKEAVINVLAEQELDLSGGAATKPPVQPAQQQQQQTGEQEPPPVATPEQETVPKQYTVDDMIQELNAIRSGRSFTDPEIYGRLVTFFRNLPEENRALMDELLTQIAELVVGIEETSEQQTQQAATQSGQAQPTPPTETPQQSSPMPGAQQAAGAAGIGTA